LLKIITVVGARPNFVKAAALHKAFVASGKIDSKIVHTGQHFDAQMSDVFFQQLEMPKPSYHLGIGQGTQTAQTAKIMLALEPILAAEKPDLIIVVGDVTSTFAAALTASKLQIPIAHVEAGLRSGDRRMPEEINRILTDGISDFLFVTEQAGVENLINENIPREKIFLVGNCMIDACIHFYKNSNYKLPENSPVLKHKKGHYALITIHRGSNTNSVEKLRKLVLLVEKTANLLDSIFPIHPGTKLLLKQHGLFEKLEQCERLTILDPQGYVEFLTLIENAAVVITDSGGVQEETTFLKVNCLTFRENTERPVTIEIGSNQLIYDLSINTLFEKLSDIKTGNNNKLFEIPPLWDGKAAERITEILLQNFKK
jgi:UDP-N-acetylglucosamine 2-epimerase (non-hydrolysing)